MSSRRLISGTTAAQMKAGSVQPDAERTIFGSNYNAVEDEDEEDPSPAAGDDDSISAFELFCRQVAGKINTAPSNGTVEVDAQNFPGFLKMVFKALAQRPDVALNIRCKIDGQATELSIPAGFDFTSALDGKAMLTFAEIHKMLG